MIKPNILAMDIDGLLALKPHEVWWMLSEAEILHIFRTLNGFWAYDYEAAEKGRVGLHAKLKSDRCSDGFFYSKIVLQHQNLRRIIAKSLVAWYRRSERAVSGLDNATLVGGIPDGAYELGHELADYMGVPALELKKVDGRIHVVNGFDSRCELLLGEDFCTMGTGFTETIRQIIAFNPMANIVPVELVILNRGGLKYIDVDGRRFFIEAMVDHRINDWDPTECPLCKMGSVPIKPKATDENWRRIITSQL